MAAGGSASVAVVSVTYNCKEAIERTLAALVPQLRSGDELIVVDNASADGTPAAIRAAAPAAVVVEAGENLGFAAACNLGAERAGADLLVLLNPDAVPEPGWREGIEAPLREGRDWGAWMGLVTAAGGREVNSMGGAVHFTGIAWAGGAGAPREAAPEGPREVGFASGACLAIPLERWRELGGFPPEYFLYSEDVDLSLRLRLRGEAIGIEPAAAVVHDYEFVKGPRKWRLLERNRWAVLIRTYPAPLLALIAPALAATELAVMAAAITGGWGAQKLAAWGGVVRALPRLLHERRAIQRGRRVSAGAFAAGLVAELDSPYLGRAGRSRALSRALRAYWRCVLALLGGPPGPASQPPGPGSSSRPRDET